MMAERIRFLREQAKLSQVDLGKKLGVTRSSINSYEQNVSTPSTQVIIAMAQLFRCSTDYLLGLEHTKSLSLDGLTEEDIQAIYSLISHLRNKNLN